MGLRLRLGLSYDKQDMDMDRHGSLYIHPAGAGKMYDGTLDRWLERYWLKGSYRARQSARRALWIHILPSTR